MIKAAFFDLDDTLIDHTASFAKAAEWLRTANQLEMAPDEFRNRWRNAHGRFYPEFLAGKISLTEMRRQRIYEAVGKMPAAEADLLFQRYFDEYQASWAVFVDVEAALRDLTAKGLLLGVITNGPSQEQRDKLMLVAHHSSFRCVIISEDCGVYKPQAEIFKRACSTLEIRPAESCYVGDSYEMDACASRSAGLVGIWLDRNRQYDGSQEGPIVSSLSEVPAFCRKTLG